jgi:protein involved in polysaccharide export with SLBB domain
MKSGFYRKISLIMLVIYMVFCFDMVLFELKVMAKTPAPQQNFRSSLTQNVFRPGDAAEINVYPDTTSFLHRTFAIDGNGYVFLPIIGKQKIAGMTSQQFANFLKENFAPYLKTPNIQVRPLIRVSLLGGFARPNLYYVDPNTTLWDLIQKAGGTLNENGLKKMKWERSRETVESDLISEYQSGRSLIQMGIRSGDQIWTPSPGKPSFVSQLLPIVGLAISALSLYGWYLTVSLRYQQQ